jgi:hypothetical protein
MRAEAEAAGDDRLEQVARRFLGDRRPTAFNSGRRCDEPLKGRLAAQTVEPWRPSANEAPRARLVAIGMVALELPRCCGRRPSWTAVGCRERNAHVLRRTGLSERVTVIAFPNSELTCASS